MGFSTSMCYFIEHVHTKKLDNQSFYSQIVVIIKNPDLVEKNSVLRLFSRNL